MVAVVVIVGVVLVAGAYLLSTTGSPMMKLVGKPVSSSDYQAMYAVSQGSYSNVNQSLMKKVTSFSGQAYVSGTKPIIVAIGADFCPYCAFQRWPLIMALMRFGNFTNLAYMLSSSTDVFPDSPTFSFYGSSYQSNYIVFQGYEQEDRSQGPLQTVPANYTGVFQQFGSSYPFIDFGNKYILSGSYFFPDQLVGKNWTQVIQLLSSNNVLSNQIITSTNAITAAICKVTPNAPSSVCKSASIAGLTTALAAYHPSGSPAGAGTALANSSPGSSTQSFMLSWTASAPSKPSEWVA